MKKTGRAASLLFLCLALNAFSQGAERLFQAGEKAFQEKLFLIAANNFALVAKQFPDDPLADDAEYLQAVSYFYLKKYGSTLGALNNFRRKYPNSPHNAGIDYWRGSAYYYSGQYGRALDALSAQIRAYQDEKYFLYQAQFLKGMVLEKLGHREDAAAGYERLLKEEKAQQLHLHSLLRLGEVYLELEDYRRALGAFTKILIDFPDSGTAAREALFFTAECYFFLNETGEAEKRYRGFLEYPGPEAGKIETIYFRLIRILGLKGEYEDALRLCEKLETDFPEGRYQDELPSVKGDLFFDLERYAEARDEYLKAVGSAGSGSEKQALYYNLGLAVRLAGKKIEALGYLRKAAAWDSEVGEKSLFQSGITLIELERDGEALAVFVQFLKRFPESSQIEEALRLTGTLYARNNFPGKAVEIFTRLLTLYPDSAFRDEYFFKRGSSVLAAGDYAGALKDFFRIVRMNPPSSLGDESRYNIGFIYSARGEYARALPYFAEILEQPGSGLESDLTFRAGLAGGVCHYNLGNYAEALGRFKEVIERGTGTGFEGEAWLNLGRTLYKMDRLEDSIESFTKAAEVLKGTGSGAEAIYWRATVLFRLGRLKKAREIFLLLTDLYPGNRRAAESFYRAGLCEAQLGNFASSIDFFDGALKVVKSQTPVSRRGRLIEEVLYQKGWSLYKIGRRNEAVSLFRTLADDFPESVLAPEAFYKLAEADFREERYGIALEGFSLVASKYPNTETAGPALYWAGASAAKTGNDAKALKYFWAYLEKSAGDGLDLAAGLAELAGREVRRILSLSPDSESIKKYYLEVEKNPSTPEYLKNQVRLEYARFIFPDEEALSILQTIRATEAREPIKSEVNFLFGEYYFQGEELERALDIFTGIAASRADRLGAAAQMNIARIHEKLGDLEAAAEEYLKVYFLYPDFELLVQEVVYRAGKLYQEIGKVQEAEKLFKKLKEEYPESVWLERLESGNSR